MATSKISIKQNLINKANTSIVAATAGAGFVVIFSLVASIALVSQMRYQSRVVSGKKEALSTLKADITATDSLADSYKAFLSTSQNAISGNPTGTGPQDGDNAKIVLDALPSTYDFPALATSLEKVLSAQNVKIQSISGTDDEVAQAPNQTSSAPQPVPMPFEFAVEGDYAAIQNVIKALDLSIRPMQIQKMDISGDQGSLTLKVTAQTFYQPGKNLKIGSKVIK